jgi:hypothetical protein
MYSSIGLKAAIYTALGLISLGIGWTAQAMML